MRAPLSIALALLVTPVAVLLAGCSGSGAGDPSLTVHLSAPLRGPDAAAGRKLVAGAREALAGAGGTAAGVDVALRVHNDEGPGGWAAARESQAARRASEDSTAIAYIGAPSPGAVMAALPITYAAGILQVAPPEGESAVSADRGPGGVRDYGFAAMAAVLDAIEEAGDPLDREAVRAAFAEDEDETVRAA